MSATDNNTTNDAPVAVKLTGRVKWFNNKTGFGFITALVDSEGVKEGSDVFVHHSAIKVAQEQYRYLVQGEYVEFVLSKLTASGAADATSSKHEFHAVDVSRVGKAVVGWILAAQPGSKRRMIPRSGPLLPPKSRRLSRDRDQLNGAGETAVDAAGGAVAQEAQVMQ